MIGREAFSGRRTRSETTTAYAKLPDELLEEILHGTSGLVDFIADRFGEIGQLRQAARRALESQGLLDHVDSLPPVQAPGISAVDGGSALERSAGVDVVLAVAVGVEGLGKRASWGGTQYRSWQTALKHEEHSPRLARGAMGILEVTVTREAPHEIVVMDGSHLTHVISINSLLVRGERSIAERGQELLSLFDVVHSLGEINSDPRIVAIPKYDSSSALIRALLGSSEVPLDDKSAMSVVLEAGEFTKPVQVPPEPWGDLRIGVSEAYPSHAHLEEQFAKAVQPLTGRQLYYTYFKPAPWASAYRVELKPSVARDSQAIAHVFAGIGTQVVSPDIREPYPQFLADEMAKSVSDGLQALRTAVQLGLATRSGMDLLDLVAHSYRTEVI